MHIFDNMTPDEVLDLERTHVAQGTLTPALREALADYWFSLQDDLPF